MKSYRPLAALILCLGVSSLALAGGPVQRDTRLAVSEPTQVGTVLLDPGSYTLRIHDFKGGKVQVTILRDSDQKTMGTATAIRARRSLNTNEQAESQTQFTYTTYNGHPAVSTWYYPGDEWGEQFIYGGNASEMTMRQTSAPAASTMAASTPPPPPAPAPAPAPAVEERHEEMKMAEAAPAPAPAASPAPAPAPAPAPKPKRQLPKTASSTPLAALLGALSLAGAAALRFARRRAA